MPVQALSPQEPQVPLRPWLVEESQARLGARAIWSFASASEAFAGCTRWRAWSRRNCSSVAWPPARERRSFRWARRRRRGRRRAGRGPGKGRNDVVSQWSPSRSGWGDGQERLALRRVAGRQTVDEQGPCQAETSRLRPIIPPGRPQSGGNRPLSSDFRSGSHRSLRA